jgi:ubiquinone/menaquinone biosynthesis C-methylase UbiE
MDPQEYSLMFEVEQSHWWYLGMEKITRAVLNKRLGSDSNLSILDAGCGTGAGMSTYLADYGNVTGMDISPLALGFCHTRHLTRLALASVTRIPFQADSFDLVTSFDVLYEQSVSNDLAAVTEFFRILRPGGLILIRLPAYDWLRGQHDLTVHTARRYTASQVTRLLRDNGFTLLHISYANTFLFPLAVAKRLLERIRPPAPALSDLSVDVGIFNRLFKTILSSEAFLAAHLGLPFGLSVIALGQKPKDS